MKKISLILLLFILVGCNNPTEEQNNNQQDTTSSGNQNELLENDSTDNIEELRTQFQQMTAILAELEIGFKNTFTLDGDNDDIEVFQDALDFSKKAREDYMKIKVVNEPEEALDLYMIGLSSIDATINTYGNHIHYLETGNLASFEASTNSMQQMTSISQEFADQFTRIYKTYLE